jgi:hypothetical protein
MRESSIVDSIVKWINSQPQAIARKRHGTVYGVAGDPDVDACVRGHCVQIEVKQPGKHPTPLQFKRLEEWGKAGADAIWVTTLDEVKQHFRRAGWL